MKSNEKINNPTPFLKWAGGKKQLIEDIDSNLPEEIKETKTIKKYFEPFIGGGAIFFHLMTNYDVKEAYISDINPELILTYNAIKNNPNELLEILGNIREFFIPKTHEERKEYYLNVRSEFNQAVPDFDFENYSEEHIQRAAYTIFMNKTCFNGLFRLNKKGEFNVPFGRYKNPNICDVENILAVSKVLKDVKIVNASFLASEEFIDDDSLVYLDPPYRPLPNTASFNTYSKEAFNDDSQVELAKYYKRISEKGAKAILSNSDPKNTDENDNFFDDLYKDFTINRVFAKRSINSNGEKRGKITEILVKNY
ncbi:MAG: DNA adenine methylase [Methanobrevibacter sp.]|uniref:DNA adenine methylase n=1 Tax=Methanobrevibacter sp. TaxID=66852 RepID=UPI0026DFA07E|nr:DNA adenine methylase [Methanobrevibacter sp.]MDO5848513.1 DNA adenine methylase [Methanobrevibacter sp.]